MELQLIAVDSGYHGAPLHAQSYDFVELWAGTAWTSTMIRKSGRTTAALDIEYFEKDPEHPQRSNHFDILTPSGFLFLGSHFKLCVNLTILKLCWNLIKAFSRITSAGQTNIRVIIFAYIFFPLRIQLMIS